MKMRVNELVCAALRARATIFPCRLKCIHEKQHTKRLIKMHYNNV